jgi:ATP-dependent Lon protease
VGGIKEKIVAAHRTGLRHIILPKDNEADLSKLPETVRKEMTFSLAEHLHDVLNESLPGLSIRPR